MRLWRSWTKIYLTIVLPIAYSKVNHEWNAPAKITYKECTTIICKEEGEDAAACMNPHVSPCEDFYEYVCGNWPQRHIDPNKQYKTFPVYIESLLKYKSFSDIRKTLEKQIRRYEDKDVTTAKILYKACINFPWMPKMKAADLRPIIEGAGLWPMFPLKSNHVMESQLDWLSIHNYYLKLTGESALFQTIVRLDPKNKKLLILELKKSASPYGIFTRLADWTLKETSGYIKFLESIAKDVKPSNAMTIPSDKFHKYFEGVLNFRIKLQNIIKSVVKEDGSMMTIDYLDQWYNQKPTVRSKKYEISWLTVLRALYENDKSAQIHKKTVISLRYPEYFMKLNDLLEETSSYTIANHIHLYFIERHLRLTREQEDLYFMSRNLTSMEPAAKMRVFPEKWYSCIEKHLMQDTLGKIYVREHSSLTAIEHIKKMIKEVKDMMKVQIDDSAWLGDKTKSATKLKVDKIQTTVGYDRHSKGNKYKDSSLYPHHPVAKYIADLNQMSITSAYFQPPIYSTSLPFNVNYASLGGLIGHEIYHSIDSKGLWYDIEGKQTRWWPQSMVDIYNQKRKCYLKQYSQYKVKEFEGYSDAPEKPYAFMTVDEDVSDTMGIKAAYEAYRLRLLKGKHECVAIPHLSNYTCDELFFIFFARTFCFAATPRQMMYFARYDEHNTPRIRVNGIVSNMKEFSDAFRCKPNAALNPKKKCDLWE